MLELRGKGGKDLRMLAQVAEGVAWMKYSSAAPGYSSYYAVQTRLEIGLVFFPSRDCSVVVSSLFGLAAVSNKSFDKSGFDLPKPI